MPVVIEDMEATVESAGSRGTESSGTKANPCEQSAPIDRLMANLRRLERIRTRLKAD